MASAYQEKLKRERAEMTAKLAAAKEKTWEKLAAKLTERGHTVEFYEPKDGAATIKQKRFIEKIDGRRFALIGITEEREGAYVGAALNGKLRITVGDWGNKKQFFQSKSRGGDFDYDVVVNEIETRIEQNKEAAEKRRAGEQTEKVAWEVRSRLIREFFGTFEERTDDDGAEWLLLPEECPIRLKPTTRGLTIEVTRPLTEAEFREVLSGCKKAGLI